MGGEGIGGVPCMIRKTDERVLSTVVWSRVCKPKRKALKTTVNFSPNQRCTVGSRAQGLLEVRMTLNDRIRLA